MSVVYTVKHANKLSIEELYGILQLRNQVFIAELECPAPDVDGEDLDAKTYHLMGKDGNRIVSYLRMHKMEDGSIYIRRVVVAKDYRGKGLARNLMNEAIAWAKQVNALRIRLHARAHLKDFYESLGFETISEPFFLETVKVWHVDMVLPLNS